MSESAFVDFRSGSWRGLVHASWRQELAGVDPLAWLRGLEHEAVRDRVSRQVYRVRSPRGLVYVKVMLGGNDRTVRRSTLLGRLKWRLRPSRAVQTLRVCRDMLDAGLWCPMPVLAARQRGQACTDVFISEAMELPSLRQRLRAEPTAAAREQLLRLVAAHIAQFHRQRFLHGDLLPHNLCVTQSLDRVGYLDNDRTRRWPITLPEPILRRNLAQFVFRLRKDGDSLPGAFLDAYAQAAGWNATRAARTARLVLRAVDQRKALQDEGEDD
jgi:hypothetical protein